MERQAAEARSVPAESILLRLQKAIQQRDNTSASDFANQLFGYPEMLNGAFSSVITQYQSLDDISLMHKLLRNGADKNLRDTNGLTPLGWAVDTNNLVALDMFLSFQANPNLKEYKLGRTALSTAVSRGSLKAVDRLISAGADVLIKDNEDCTALDLAVISDRVDIMKLLLPPMKAQGTSINIRPALNISITRNNQKAAIYLLDHLGYYTPDEQGRRPIHLAAGCGAYDILSLLLARLSAGPPLELPRDYDGWNILH